MKVNYTLPGMLPEASLAPAAETGEHPSEPFGVQLERLRVPEFVDWRSLLRLDATPPGLAGLAPPPAPHGLGARDGASERAWRRGVLQRHGASSATSASDATAEPAVQRMLSYLHESLRREDEIFARQLAEGGN